MFQAGRFAREAVILREKIDRGTETHCDKNLDVRPSAAADLAE
jgi:hypothetical protein